METFKFKTKLISEQTNILATIGKDIIHGRYDVAYNKAEYLIGYIRAQTSTEIRDLERCCRESLDNIVKDTQEKLLTLLSSRC